MTQQRMFARALMFVALDRASTPHLMKTSAGANVQQSAFLLWVPSDLAGVRTTAHVRAIRKLHAQIKPVTNAVH